jgi:hypothetical protein
MAVYKIQLEEINEIDYQLIAIHTPLEDYQLAYHLNKNLPVHLSKSKNGIMVNTKIGETELSLFEYNDTSNQYTWNLIQNKNVILQNQTSKETGLFMGTTQKVTSKGYLLPEFKTVDYLLKIESDLQANQIENISQQINKIERVTTVYSIKVETIKSKNNLIF